MSDCFFALAKPVWPDGREKEMNMTVGYRADITYDGCGPVLLRVAASTLYRAFLNGSYIGSGPARGPHGYARLDEWDVTRFWTAGNNIVAIEVAGYNTDGFYFADQSSFLQAEVCSPHGAIAYTAATEGGFVAVELKNRVQKVQRYSFQRSFSEVYKLNEGYKGWIKNTPYMADCLELAVQPQLNLLKRGTAYPAFSKRNVLKEVTAGNFTIDDSIVDVWKDRSLTSIGRIINGYPEDEIEALPSVDLQKFKYMNDNRSETWWDRGLNFTVCAGQYRIEDFGTNLTGFIGSKLSCTSTSKLYMVFDEVLSEGDVDFKRLQCINAITLDIEPGEYEFESIEPYTMRYIKLIVTEGQCSISGLTLKEYTNPDVYRAQFACNDARINTLFEAGRETFRQNAVDLLMDCPSRERAGWLCDSYFTARSAVVLSGNTTVERCFLENYLLCSSSDHLPDGMVPMCYPSENLFCEPYPDGHATYIPNWSLWLIIQLEEYLKRSGDRTLVSDFQEKISKLLNFFSGFENEYGLLENLDNWVFVEWSRANEFTQDVNFPTNMLYAGALEAAGRLYNRMNWLDKAREIKSSIRKMGGSKLFFSDNAVRSADGTLYATDHCTEVCQYYAYYFGIATQQTHPELWNVLVESFGPNRKATKLYQDVFPANAFVGNYLRMELLSSAGLISKLHEETIGYMLYMAERTGTLWENDGAYASCNHGFASHVDHVFVRDLLGIKQLDKHHKKITLCFRDTGLQWCQGRIPVDDSYIFIKWRVDQGELIYKVEIPDGYILETDKSEMNITRSI